MDYPKHLKEYAAQKAAAAKAGAWDAVRVWWAASSFRPSFRYLLETEAHVYAFSIAANALLAFFPFTLILLTLCRHALHWDSVYAVIIQLVQANLPEGADFVVKGLTTMAEARRRIEIISVVLMFYTSSGVFLPLEVALNKVWKIEPNRNIWRNIFVSFLLAVASGLLALLSLAIAGGLEGAIHFLFGWIPGQVVVAGLSRLTIELVSVPLMIAIYFMIYTLLPNGKVPARQVLPAAILAGVATEAVKLIYFLTLPLFHFRATYGPFAVPVTLLFWAYASSLVLLWGAHFSAQVPSQQPPLDFIERPSPAVDGGSE
ncbi:MAG TPA: YihY/virulence factor BrkB family protein [Terriglobia bacterium]|nr:YihY/virulence factor BrkB family protein [Terriglobia bacterium]